MLNKFKIYLITTINLKFIQIYYQIYYRIKFFFIKNKRYSNRIDKIIKIKWKDGTYNLKTYLDNNTFKFLNISHAFEKEINWNIKNYGKLWNLNLNYFDYLNQNGFTKNEGLKLIYSFIIFYDKLDFGKESYPTSIRVINWIKFISKHNINDEKIYKIIREDSNRLMSNIEYHILGNHLLENGFSLLFSSILFDDNNYFKKSKNILKKEINEQILNDGGHFELSPMYHQEILYRILDSINILNNNKNKKDLIFFLRKKSCLMISWLENILYSNGDFPLVNDSANKVYPKPEDILNYAKSFNMKCKKIPLSDSGYRMIKNNNFELFIDIGQIGPKYQPGHAHADTFNFELYLYNKPIIVDTGTSTYSDLNIRNLERSTKSHNTVEINNTNSSLVWDKFRVANHSNVIDTTITNNSIVSIHDGYKRIGNYHKRKWLWDDKKIIINDSILGEKNNFNAFIHFHPDVKLKLFKNFLLLNNKHKVIFEFHDSINLFKFNYAPEFNKCLTSNCVEIKFKRKLISTIHIN